MIQEKDLRFWSKQIDAIKLLNKNVSGFLCSKPLLNSLPLHPLIHFGVRIL